MKRLLLVDDDPAIVELLGKRLGAHYDVVATTDPREAAALARTYKPELVLCDFDMPGMNGSEVAIEVRREAGNIPLLFLTGLVSPAEAGELPGKAGLDRHHIIAKRAPHSELLACIKSLIGD